LWLMKGFFLLLLPLTFQAQTPDILKIANEISISDLHSNVYKLAAPEMEGSFTGTRGDTLAAEHISNWFKKNRLLPPYNNGASFFQSVPLDKILITKAEIRAAGKKYQQFNDWYVFPNSTYKSIKLDSVPVVFGGYGIVSDRYNDLLGENVEGKIVIIVQVQPVDKISEALAKATRSSISSDYLKNLSEKKAAGVLVVTNDFDRSSKALKISGELRSFRNPATVLNPLPRIYVSEKMINELLQPNDVSIQSLLINMRRSHRPLPFLTKAIINIDIQIDSVRAQAPNVMGIIQGKDTTAEAVVIAAHHDHLGKRNGQVFPGASDNAGSSAALMEIAKLMQKAAEAGLRPKRSIVFASFTGEEIGVLGSYYYTQNPLYPTDKTWAVYNLNALGSPDSFHTARPDSNYVCFLIRDTLRHGLLNAMVASNELLKLNLDDRYQEPEFPNRWLISTDAISFYMKGIPVIQTGSGYPKNFHQSTDTPDKVSFSLLALQTKQAFLTLWNIANK
jgi:hypothetical protein